MLWHRWRQAALLLILCHPGSYPVEAARWTDSRKVGYRDQVRDLWYHGFDAYMNHAFPFDELRPLTCQGHGPDWHDPTNIAVNDVNGNFSLTLIDSLSALVVLGDRARFSESVHNVVEYVPTFDLDTRPQVFETTIRVLGGLLSAHIFAISEEHGMRVEWYKGELLDLAEDLGKRLLKAFNTPTGMPFARVNLRHGMRSGETAESCSAGVASLVLEFATLSRLTGKPVYEAAARKAFYAVWNRRSDLNLVGNSLNVVTGAWVLPLISGIGAGIDSFYEYALKSYILLGEPDFLDVWHESYAAVMKHLRGREGFWFRNTWMDSGLLASVHVDALSAFWPGLQVLGGDIQNAIKSHLVYWNLWRRYSAMPERFNIINKEVEIKGYPLRPEFVESNYFLYRATKDPFYLDVGARILGDLQRRTYVRCGIACLRDVETGQLADRMESFVLSETLKYLYLLFDENHPFHLKDIPIIYTTEGHPLILPEEMVRPPAGRHNLRQAEKLSCPAYYPPLLGIAENDQWSPGIVGGVKDRVDVETARHLVGGDDSGQEWWTADGWCEVPQVEEYAFDFILSTDGKPKPEDLAPNAKKLRKVADGFVLNDISGIRAHIVRRLDDKGYDITKLGPHRVLTGQTVYVNDSRILRPVAVDVPSDTAKLELSWYSSDSGSSTDWVAEAWTASFGPAPSAFPQPAKLVIPTVPPVGFGCSPLTPAADPGPAPASVVWLVQRGECNFLEKLMAAKQSGARGVLVLSNEAERITPSLGEGESWEWEEGDTWLVVLSRAASAGVVERVQKGGGGQLWVNVQSQQREVSTRTGPRHLFVDGKPLVNTVLMD
ncbi:glycoside hydrolase family 47 protein [Calocera cornea HHB12733]|uniref:alpha-1,2-Mannosidase n=1 Tax=Calocera cornea HHB12733 TaxID=1353952 RepID=A0A165H3V4_9BASI|nr:glycoside hydrolase family 47 protein [Calocera cornea HHB12733]